MIKSMLDLLNEFIQDNIPLFGVVAFLGMALGYWRAGGFKIQKNIIENFKMRVEQLEKDVIRLTAADLQKAGEIGRLNGVIGEKDKYINMLKEVSLDRNPEMKRFVDIMTSSAKRNEARDDRIMRALEGIERHFNIKIPKKV